MFGAFQKQQQQIKYSTRYANIDGSNMTASLLFCWSEVKVFFCCTAHLKLYYIKLSIASCYVCYQHAFKFFETSFQISNRNITMKNSRKNALIHAIWMSCANTIKSSKLTFNKILPDIMLRVNKYNNKLYLHFFLAKR